MQLQSSKLWPSRHQVARFCSATGVRVLQLFARIRQSSSCYGSFWGTTKLAHKFHPGMGTNRKNPTSSNPHFHLKGQFKTTFRKIKIKMYVETVVPTVSFELSDMQQLPPDKTTCNKCCGIQSTTEPSALWYQCVIAPRC